MPLFERITLPFAKNLERLGITAQVRTVDTAQYKNRIDDFDFDMVVGSWPRVALARQRAARATGARRAPISRAAATCSASRIPVVDELVEQVIAAPDRASLVARMHALDRVLLWGFYVIPQLVHRLRPRRLLGQVRPPRP